MSPAKSRSARVNAPSPEPKSAHTPACLVIAFLIRLTCSKCFIGNKNRQPEENVEHWLDDLKAADGYIFICPEYNEAPSAALKNALDFVAFETKRKPAVIIGYSDGANGGMYAPMQLRVVLGELDTVALSTQQIILNAGKAINEDGIALIDQKESLERRFARMVSEIIWYTDALKTAREKE